MPESLLPYLFLGAALGVNVAGILGIQALHARRAREEEAFQTRRGGALLWWILGGCLVGILAGLALNIRGSVHLEVAPPHQSWGYFFDAFIRVPSILAGAVVGGFLGGAFLTFRRGWRAGLTYLGLSVLALTVLAFLVYGIANAGRQGLTGDHLLGYVVCLYLLTPILWALIAGWTIRQGCAVGRRPLGSSAARG